MLSESKYIIVYQVYGKRNLFNQVLFSLLTLHFHLKEKIKETRIVIYTDNPQFFSKYNSDFDLNFEILDSQKLQTFKGKLGFLHRVKICIIKDCIEKYKANILYLDSDTYFNESPLDLLDQISNTTSIMNSDDYDLIEADDLYENMDWLEMRKAIKNFNYNVGDSKIKIPLKTRMWNAGVIGISYTNGYLLEQVLDLSDQIYANKKVFTAEQYAFSYVLQNHTHIISSGNYITHYWPNHIGMYWKNQYDQQISRFLKKNKSKPINEKRKLAFELTKKHNEIILPLETKLIEKVTKRICLIWKVATKGKV